MYIKQLGLGTQSDTFKLFIANANIIYYGLVQ